MRRYRSLYENQDIISQIREYASRPENYENGWDVVVESWGDEDIVEAIEGAVTVGQAIKILKSGIEGANDVRGDIEAEGRGESDYSPEFDEPSPVDPDAGWEPQRNRADASEQAEMDRFYDQGTL